MSTPNTQVAAPKKGLTIRDRLQGDAFRGEIAKALPKHLTPDRQIRVALTAITRTPKLAECDQASFFAALLTLSQLGLEPDGRRAHLIPFENRKRGVVECQLIIDYKGLVELVMRSGLVSNIHADVVCENDEFEFDRGELKRHRIDFRKPRGPAYAVYAIARFKDGGEKCEVMTSEEVEAIRQRSRAGQSGPWVTDWSEMAKKTVFRRLSKWLPLSPEFRDAMDSDADQIEKPVIDIPSAPVNLLPPPAPEPEPIEPVVSEPETEREIPSEVNPVPQALLASFVSQCGHNFDKFVAAVRSARWFQGDGIELWTSFDDVPTEFAEKCMAAKSGLKRELAK